MRHCDGCTLCCSLMPIKEIGKPAGVNCKHQVGGEVETEEAHKARGKRLGL